MAWSNEMIEFHGVIPAGAWSQKAVLFCGDNWLEESWIPRLTKKGDPIMEIIEHDHESGEATIKIAKWLVDKHEEWK